MTKYPGTFPIYKKIAAAQFTLLPPRRDDNGRISKNGAVLLEVAKSSGERKYNWSEKISFAIGMSDICNIMENPDNPPRLVHQMPGSDVVKSLELQPGEGRYEGTYMLKLSENNKKANVSKFVSVPIGAGEYQVMMRMLMHASPLIVGW
jgi:hypothetical protein